MLYVTIIAGLLELWGDSSIFCVMLYAILLCVMIIADAVLRVNYIFWYIAENIRISQQSGILCDTDVLEYADHDSSKYILCGCITVSC